MSSLFSSFIWLYQSHTVRIYRSRCDLSTYRPKKRTGAGPLNTCFSLKVGPFDWRTIYKHRIAEDIWNDRHRAIGHYICPTLNQATTIGQFGTPLLVMFSMMLEQLPSLQLLTTTGSIFALIWLLHVFVYKPFTSPLKNVPCPPGGTGSQGHIAEIME